MILSSPTTEVRAGGHLCLEAVPVQKRLTEVFLNTYSSTTPNNPWSSMQCYESHPHDNWQLGQGHARVAGEESTSLLIHLGAGLNDPLWGLDSTILWGPFQSKWIWNFIIQLLVDIFTQVDSYTVNIETLDFHTTGLRALFELACLGRPPPYPPGLYSLV